MSKNRTRQPHPLQVAQARERAATPLPYAEIIIRFSYSLAHRPAVYAAEDEKMKNALPTVLAFRQAHLGLSEEFVIISEDGTQHFYRCQDIESIQTETSKLTTVDAVIPSVG